MKITSLLLGLTLTTIPVWAGSLPESVPLPEAAVTAGPTATVTPFLTGLKEPQGMALNKYGNILVCDYGAGAILRFSQEGKPMGAVSTDLKGPAQMVTFPFPPWTSIGVPPADYVTLVTLPKVNQVWVVQIQLVPSPSTSIYPLNGEIDEPVGLVDGALGLLAVSRSTSQIYRWKEPPAPIPHIGNIPLISLFRSRKRPPTRLSADGKWELFYAPKTEGERYGFGGIVSDDEACFMSDDVGQQVLRLTDSFVEGTRLVPFATGIPKPSGLAIGPDKMIYVANEGDGGQLLRLDAQGRKSVVAEKLGRPSGVLFLDAKTVLVSNRDGNVWKVQW